MFSTANTLAVTKAAIAQLTSSGYMGEDFTLDKLTDTEIVDLGEKLNISNGEVTNNSPADIFFKALMGQCGKIVIDTRSYAAQLPKLFVDTINWGILTEQITIELSDIMVDEMWNPDGFIAWNAADSAGVNEGSRIAAIEFGCYKPPVTAKIYKKAKGIMAALTVAREQMFTAFRGLDEYNSFLAGLYNSVENALQLKAEVYALMTVSMGIAKAKALNNEINLLYEYKQLVPTATITAANALQDAGFLKFALMRIAETKDNIKRFTTLYNNHEHLTFASDPNMIILNKFSNACKFNVRADTYHEELLGIGDYDKVSSWQANVSDSDSTPFNFGAASTISLSKTAAEEAGLDNGLITGVVGVIYDRFAMGVTLDKKKTTSQYSASRDTVNYFYHSLVNYIVNDNYPIVVFVIRDEVNPIGSAEVTIPADSTDWWGTTEAQLGSLTMSGGKITGTLNKITTGQIVTDWGEGYFLGIKVENSDAEKIFVGLDPTQGSGLVQLEDDGLALLKLANPDNGAFTQKVTIVQIDENGKRWTQAVDITATPAI